MQKSQPIGQPTDGIIVAAVSRLLSGYTHAEDAKAEARQDLRVHHRRVSILTKESAHPRHAFAAHVVNPRDLSAHSND